MKISEFGLKPKRIVHLGAYYADELLEYENVNPEFVVWAEANPKLWPMLIDKFSKSPCKHALVQRAITDKDDEDIEFNLFNHDEASSIFDIGSELNKWYPNHRVSETVSVKTITVDTMLERLEVDPNGIEYMSVDLQGAEILALRGAHKLLEGEALKWVQSEVVFSEFYKDGADGDAVKALLEGYGFFPLAHEQHNDPYQFNVMFKRF